MRKQLFLCIVFTIYTSFLFGQNKGSITINGVAHSVNHALLINDENGYILIFCDDKESPSVTFAIRDVRLEPYSERQDFSFLDISDDMYCPLANFSGAFYIDDHQKTDDIDVENPDNKMTMTLQDEIYNIDYHIYFKDGIAVAGRYSGTIEEADEADFFTKKAELCETGSGNLTFLKEQHDINYVTITEEYGVYTITFFDKNNNCDKVTYSLSFKFEKFPEGKFTFLDYYESKFDADKNFHDSYFTDYESWEYYYCKKGTVTFKTNGDDDYSCQFSLTLNNGKKLKGSYRGALDYLKADDYDDDYYNYDEESLDLTQFNQLSINTEEIKKHAGVIAVSDKNFPVDFAATVRYDDESAFLLLMPDSLLSAEWINAENFPGSYLLCLRLLTDENGQVAEIPRFYSSYYGDDALHFDETYLYFFAPNGDISKFSYCKDGFLSTTKKEDAYVLNYTFIFEDNTIVSGNYTGKINTNIDLELDFLDNWYFYNQSKTSLDNPYPDFDPENVTLKNAFTINNASEIALPFAYLVQDEARELSKIILTDRSMSDSEKPARTISFRLDVPIDTLSNENFFYDGQNAYFDYYENGISSIEYITVNEKDIVISSNYQYAAVYLSKIAEHRYKIIYRLTSAEGDILIGAFEGDIPAYTFAEFSTILNEKTTKAAKGKGTMTVDGKSYPLTSFYNSDYEEDNLVFVVSKIELMFNDNLQNFVAFMLESGDGSIPEGTFTYCDKDKKRYNPRKNFSYFAFAIYDEGDYYPFVYGNGAQGSITVKKENDAYRISFDIVSSEKEKVTGEFLGMPLKLVEQ